MLRLESSNKVIGWSRLDFDSPRTREAAARLGIRREDCVMKQINEFFGPEVDSRVAKLSYDIHLKRVKECIMEVRAYRRKVIQREKRIKLDIEKSSQQEGSYEPSIKSVKEGLLESQEMKICPGERKAMCDFVSRVLQEQSFNRKKMNTNIKKAVHRPNVSAQSVRNLGNTLSTKYNSSQKRNANNSSSSKQSTLLEKPSTFKHTFSDPLFVQVETRLEGAQKLAKYLEAEKKKQAQADLVKDKEEDLILAELEAVNKKMERADFAIETKKPEFFKKINSARNKKIKALEKVQEIAEINAIQSKAFYMSKAAKIFQAKKIRAVNVQKIKQEIHQQNISERHHNNAYKEKLKEQFDKYQKELRKSLETRDIRLLETEKLPLCDRRYLSEKRLLTKKLHNEKLERLQRIREDKRRRILQKHIALEEINKQRHHLDSQLQLHLRNKNRTEKESTNRTLEVLAKLWRSNPNSKAKQEELLKAAERINAKFRLGLPLTIEMPKPENSLSSQNL